MECPNPKCVNPVNVTSCGLHTGKWKCMACGTVFPRDRPKEGFVIGVPPQGRRPLRQQRPE